MPNVSQQQPQLTAAIFCTSTPTLTLANLYDSVKSIAPSCTLGDWSGPLHSPLSDDRPLNMLSVDGVRLALLIMDNPLPADALQTGPCPNLLMLDAKQKLANHRAHMLVVPADRPMSREERIATARSVTLLAWAAALAAGAEAGTTRNRLFP